MDDQVILKNIGELLWRGFPEGFQKIVFEAFLYEDLPMSTTFLVDNEGNKRGFGKDRFPREYTNQVMNLSKKLRTTPVFKKEPFNHIRVSLNAEQKIRLEVGNIDREDSWSALFMKAVSELTEEEAKQNYIPKNEWEDRVAKFAVKSKTV